MKNFREMFEKQLVVALETALATAKKEDAKVNAVLLDFDVAGLLTHLGAKDVKFEVAVNGDAGNEYTFLRIGACDESHIYSSLRDASQRHQARPSEVAAMKQIKNSQIIEARCKAGLSRVIEGEGENATEVNHWSFRWEYLTGVDEDGAQFTIEYTGPVRKWNEATKQYDAPVCAE